MKYFNRDWYNEKYFAYYDFMERNYEYYPKWFREYDPAGNRLFLFRNSSIYMSQIEDANISIEMTGIEYMVFKGYKLIFENVKEYRFPDDINDGNVCYDVVSEELYCDETGMELYFLLIDDEGRLNEDFHIKCEKIGIIFEKNPIENRHLYSIFKEEIKRRKTKNNEVFY